MKNISTKFHILKGKYLESDLDKSTIQWNKY